MTYGYHSRLHNNQSKLSIEDFARQFLEHLQLARKEEKVHNSVKAKYPTANVKIRQDKLRPIIFIGHSMGGLIVKEALSIAGTPSEIFGEGNDDNMKLFLSCYGLLLFGVPNRGLKHPLLVDVVKRLPNEQLINDLLADDDGEPRPLLKKLDQAFRERFNFKDSQVVSFYEKHLSPTVVGVHMHDVCSSSRVRRSNTLQRSMIA